MANIAEILQVERIAEIVKALRDMGLKVNGEVNVPDLLKLIPVAKN
jgi:hypothetical protein